MRCPSCGGEDIEHSEASGESVCIACGTILEESTIVNAIEFSENAAGSSSIVGKLVSGTATRTYGGIAGGYGLSRESREIVIDNGKRTMQQLSSTLRLSQHVVDSAHRLFMLAVEHNFIQGRKTMNVIAACLYIVCRREKSEHLLIDFADSLQINVYALGACFLKFTRLLSIQLPVIDPSLYIHRFAAKLDLGDKRQIVSTTALRIVQRMRRDWLHTGRRPAGICGAALLLAAHMHGFDRTRDEVLKIVRVTDDTLRTRLAEFGNTATGALTPEEFETMELDDECDPPSFTRNEIEEKLRLEGLTPLMLENGIGPPSTSGDEVDEGDESKETPVSRKVGSTKEKQELMYSQIEATLADELEQVRQANVALLQNVGGPSFSPAPVAVTPRPSVPQPAITAIEDDEELLSDNDDAIACCLLSEEDARHREQAWLEKNKEYLKEKQEKLARGDPVPPPRKRRRAGDAFEAGGAVGMKSSSATDGTTGDAQATVPAPRKSKKLNYSALAGGANIVVTAEEGFV